MGRRAPLITATTATLLLLGGCHHDEPDRARGSAPALLARVPTASPGFPPAAAAAKGQLAGLKVEWGRNWQTYRREEFGRYWSDGTDAVGGRNGCDTRDDVLRRDLKELREGDRNPCVVVSGVLDDPYTGTRIPYSYRRASQIQTDHVVALGAAWRGGAYAWTPRRRLEYANDLDVLLAVDKQTNQDKGSRTADKWKPPRRAFWCEYGRRYTGIKAKYGLSVTPPEKTALEELLATCPG
ncbi:HNH endonuclease family protein [Streptomyces sp. NPDC057939]|uniref:HNH endonuclease family protein n=1 Tax=Streptomyces sp. NPDC057939 TaxID=3346284 RepID=UPI0036E56409